MINKELKKIDSDLFELRGKFKLIPDITPLNISEERKTFFTKRNKGIRYNPRFVYEESTNKQYIPELEVLKSRLDKIDHPLTVFYHMKIDFIVDWISNFDKRDHSSFPVWLSEMYQKPTEELFHQASSFRLSKPELKVKESFSVYPSEAKEFIVKTLESFGFVGWKVEVTHMTAKMSVNSLHEKIKINKDKRFSRESLERLGIHEIGTHVFRNENGRTQPYQIFQYGLPDYLDTEEGLALWSEYVTGVRVKEDDIRYRVRVMACYKCFEMDFYELFNYTLQFLDKNTAFDTVARIKRGLEDTSQYGGYTKDQVYYMGFLKIEKLSKEEIRKLYVGKISVEHLPILEEVVEMNWNFQVPEWIK
jgi:hypothetical protein